MAKITGRRAQVYQKEASFFVDGTRRKERRTKAFVCKSVCLTPPGKSPINSLEEDCLKRSVLPGTHAQGSSDLEHGSPQWMLCKRLWMRFIKIKMS